MPRSYFDHNATTPVAPEVLDAMVGVLRLGYGNAGGTRAVQHLKHILAELQVASLKFAVHIGMIEMIGMLREGKTMADYPYLDETAVKMLDDMVWWANTLRAGRLQQAEAAAA